MDKDYYKSFLSFIKNAGKVAKQSPDVLKEYTDKLNAFLEYSRNINREHIPMARDIARTLMANGTHVEGAQVLFDEAKIYLRDGDLKKYYGLTYKGFVYIFAAVFIPELYSELLNMINEVEKTAYYPFFLFQKGYVEHIHMREYELALADYLKAKDMVQKLDDSICKLMGISSKNSLEWMLSLDIVDVLFKLAMSNREESEYYLAMADQMLQDLTRKFGSLGKLANHIELFWVQYFIIKGEVKKGREILDAFLKKHDREDWFGGYKSIVAYLETLYFWSMGDYKSTIKHLKGAISEAIGSGDETMTRETIDFALFLLESSGREFSIYSKEGEEVLNTLLGILFSKDWYLGIDHSTKVAELSLKIAKEYTKLTGIEIDEEKIYMAGLLHDIGKLYVPWYVLNKPSRLNQLEWLCIKYHPVYGREIMERIGLGEFAKYVEEHHERNDGTGYPYGKKNLPPVSQIIGIADIFEAATTANRHYKNPKNIREILKELKEMRGTKFDNTVIKALMDVFGKNVKEPVT